MSPFITLRELADAYAFSILEGRNRLPSPETLRELLADASPEVSAALRDMIGDLDKRPTQPGNSSTN